MRIPCRIDSSVPVDLLRRTPGWRCPLRFRSPDRSGSGDPYNNNPFLIWGKYRKKWLRATLPVSFQFHHTQMDGIPAAAFLERLQGEIRQAGRKH